MCWGKDDVSLFVYLFIFFKHPGQEWGGSIGVLREGGGDGYTGHVLTEHTGQGYRGLQEGDLGADVLLGSISVWGGV